VRPRGGTVSAPISRSTVRQSLETLLAETVAESSALGYAVAAVSFGDPCEVTLEKHGATFVVWLKPAGDAGPCYRNTARFKIGHREDPPDKLGYALLDATCARIEAWERSLPDGVQTELFTQTRPPLAEPATDAVSLDSVAEVLLSRATFHLIYQDWLDSRERQLATRFDSIASGRQRNILLVNATRGLQFYASMVDFFALLQRAHAGIRVTSASYFDGIFQFHQGVAAKGFPVVSVAELMTWGPAEINRFDVVILIGASDVMARLMALDGVSARLVLLDLGFYHQLLESHPGWYPGAGQRGEQVICDQSSQVNRVIGYSCQPEDKVALDLAGVCSFRLFEWRWFNYIPIGFTYSRYYRSSECAFDVALLGRGGRDYAQIDPTLFRGMRFLFLGDARNAPEIDRIRTELDVTIVSRVNEDTYARLLALCRCVVLPAHIHHVVNNVFLSVVDTVASGKALVTPRHVGLARLEQEGLPAVFYDNTSPDDLFAQVDDVIARAGRLEDIAARSIAFAKEQLDIYRVLGRILEEQVL